MENNLLIPHLNPSWIKPSAASPAIIDAANQMITEPAVTNDQHSSPTSNPLSLEAIRAHVQELLNKPKPNHGLFVIKPADSWMQEARNRPPQQMLFAEFWFEDELCILFADTNLGKSILAVQIGDSIAKGQCIKGFPTPPAAQPVLYFDFELTDKQFENRYTDNDIGSYRFGDNFLRIEFNPDAHWPENIDMEDHLINSIEQAIIAKAVTVLIIDNLTYLKNETEKAKDALSLMKQLKELKNKYKLSILVLAHTPKRDMSKPISRNDLSGSKMLINFCDSAFAIGESFKDNNLRYLKQIKQRNTEQLYGGNNIIVCQINKAANFLQFDIVAFDNERDHLREATDKENTDIKYKVLELSKQGMTVRDIAHELALSRSAVGRMVKQA